MADDVTVVNPGPQAPGLGLIHEERPKDHEFLARAAFPELRQVRRRATILHALFALTLDQGETGTCVGHAARQKMDMTPRRITKGPDAIQLYLRALLKDRWPENDWGDLQSGTSLDAVAKVLLELRMIESWHHIFDFDELCDYMGGVDENGKHVGDPVLLGLPWPSNWFRTDDAGYMAAPSGRFSGGHCIVSGGYHEEDGHTPFANSWGQWGARRKVRGKHTGPRTGWGKIRHEHMRQLFTQHWGHAVVLRGERNPA